MVNLVGAYTMLAFLQQAANPGAARALGDMQSQAPTVIVAYQVMSMLLDCAFLTGFLGIITITRWILLRRGKTPQ